MRELFIETAAEEAVASSHDVPLGEMIRFGRSAWGIEGPTPGTPVASEVRVTGIPGAPSDGMLARVVDDRPIGQGDVGLLKVATTGMPALELATGPGPAVGTPLLVAGYPESVGERIGPAATASFDDGLVDGVTTDGGRPVYRTDAQVEVGTSGGPVFDDSGRVLGINSVRTSGSQMFDLVIPVSGFTDLLGRNGLRAELGPRDLRYREALDAHHRGEYTDAIGAIDRLQQEGPVHRRVDELRSDAEASRDLHGDASENRLTQLLVRGSVGVGAIVLVVIGALLVVRRRRANPGVMMPPPHPPFPGPWGGPCGPVPHPVWQAGPRAGAPNHPYGRPAHPRPPIAGPGRPGSAPHPGVPFDGPTRAIRTSEPSHGSES